MRELIKGLISVVSELHWWSSESNYHGFDSQLRQGEQPISRSSKPTLMQAHQYLSHLHMHNTYKDYCTHEIPMSTFLAKEGIMAGGMEHTKIAYNSSRIFNMMIMATPNGRSQKKSMFPKSHKVWTESGRNWRKYTTLNFCICLMPSWCWNVV